MNRRALSGEAYVPTDPEHLANMVTHGVSIIYMIYLCTEKWFKNC